MLERVLHYKEPMYFKLYIFVFIGICNICLYAQNFELIGPPGNHPYDIEANPFDNSIYYAGTNNNLIFKTDDGGNTTKFLGKLGWVIAINPLNPNIIYTSSFSEDNYCSLDGGETWSKMNINKRIFDYEINPLNPNRIYAFDPWDKEIWSTKNGGESWFLVTTFDQWIKTLVDN